MADPWAIVGVQDAPKQPGSWDVVGVEGGGKGGWDIVSVQGDESTASYLGRRLSEGNKGVARAHAGAELAAIENYDVDAAAQDYAKPRLPGDIEPASMAFFGEQDGKRLRFAEQKNLLGGDMGPIEATQRAAREAFGAAQTRKADVLLGEINANSPDPNMPQRDGLAGFAGDVAANLPRLGRTMGVAALTAPVGGAGAPAYMAEQIFGETYAGYRQQGKDPERSAVAAGLNALAQAPLEYLPTRQFLNLLGNRGGKIAAVAKIMASEGATEYAQSYPEAFADVYVDNPEASPAQLAKLFFDKVTSKDFQKQAAYEGAVGAVTGGGLAGATAGVQRLAEGKRSAQASPQAESLHAVADRNELPPTLAAPGEPGTPPPAEPLAAPGARPLLERIVGAESGGDVNAKNPASTARGLGQMIKGTRDFVLAQSGLDGWSQDPEEQRKAAEWLLNRNREQMASILGRDPSDAEQYTGWFLGPAGAVDFITALEQNPADLAANHVSAAVARANKGIFFEGDRPRTLAEVFDLMGRKVGGKSPSAAQVAPRTPSEVNAQEGQPDAPQGEFGPLRPELAELRQDMQSRQEAQGFPEASTSDPWIIVSVQDAAGRAAGVPSDMAQANELRSLRNDILARETQQRVLEEQGVTLPVREAERLGQAAALPPGQSTPPSQTFDMVQTPQQQDVAAMSWQDLVREGLGLGIRSPMRMKADALREAVSRGRQEQTAAAVTAPNDMRVQIKPMARTPEAFPTADEMLGQRVHFSPRESGMRPQGRGLTVEQARNVVTRLQNAIGGAAPMRVITRAEIPPRVLESAKKAGHRAWAIEGWQSRDGVVLVADNLTSGQRAVEVWLHEQVAHHGLRQMLGGELSTVLEAVRRDHKAANLVEAEEIVARIAEKLDAGQALNPREGFTWRKVVDAVRAWLAKRGISVSRPNLEALLRQSLRQMARGGEQQGQGMQEAQAYSGRPQDYTVEDATMPRQASTFIEARKGAVQFLGKPLVNDTTGMVAKVSRNSVDKMLSKSAVSKSVSPQAQSYAVANLDKLFKHAEALETHPDRDNNDAFKAIHRMYAPMIFNGEVLVTKLTVKELAESRDGNRIYSVEAMEMSKPAGIWVASVPGQGQGNSTPQAGFMEKVRALADQVKSGEHFSMRDVSLSDYQRKKLSTGGKAADFDLSRMGTIARMLFTDRSAPAMEMVRSASGDAGAREFDKQFRRQSGVQGIVHDMVSEDGSGVSRYGVQGGEMEVVQGSKTLGAILAPLAKSFQRYLDFNTYMVAMREAALSERNERTAARIEKIRGDLATLGKDVATETDTARRNQLEKLRRSLRDEGRGLQSKIVSNLDEVQATIELQRLEEKYGHQGIAQFAAMHKEMIAWLDQAVLRPRVDAGLLSQEAYDAITKAPEHEFYAAFQREMERDGVSLVGGRGGPKRIKGSARKIIPPVESALAAVVRNVSEVEQAKTNQVLIDARNASPELAKEITPAKAPGRGTITTYSNGVARHWAVPWEVAAGLNGLSPAAARIIRYVGNATLLRPAAQLLRMGTTMFSFAFSLRNVVRDNLHAMTTSAHGYNPAMFLGGVAEYLKDMTGKDSQAVREWRRSGGETGIYTAMEQSMVQTTVEDMLGFRKETSTGRAVRYATSPFRAIQALGEMGEKATRIALYQNARRKGASASDAMLESRDTTVDFARAGLAGQVINQIIPFWNANVQGLSKLARTIKERPGRFAIQVALGATIPSILEWAAYHDEDWWKELSAREKDLFWHVSAFGSIIRIPKPFEIGVLFGSLPVRMLEWWETKDANGMAKVAGTILDGMTPPFSNPLVTTAIENATNHSFFSGRPLESKSMENLQPWMRFNQTTSEIAKEFGRITDISPIKLDNWIRGLTGTVGRDISRSLDAPINAMRGKERPPAPAKPWYEMTPGLSGFISRTPQGSRSESVQDFYDNLDRTGQAAGTRSALEEAGNAEDLARLDAKDVFFAPAFKRAATDISGMRKEIAAINESMTMGPDEKRTSIDAIEVRMTARARELNDAYNRNEPTPEALFYGVKAQVTAAKEAYDAAKRAGNDQEAARIMRETGLDRLYPQVRDASARLSQISSARNKLEENTKIQPAAREKWARVLDEQEAKVLGTFMSRVGNAVRR